MRDRDPDEAQADELAAERDPDPQHAGPAEATDDPGDNRPAAGVEDEPGELPAELPDASDPRD